MPDIKERPGSLKKDILIYFAGKLIPAGVNLGIIILAVRLLGKTEYGKYSLVFNAAMLVSMLTIGWIQQSMLRFVSAYQSERTLIINRFFFLTMASGVSAVLLGIAVCIFYFHLHWTDTIVVVCFIFMYNYFLFHLTLNQSSGKSLNYAILESSYTLLFFLGFLLLVFVFNQHLYNTLFIAMLTGLILTEFLRVTLLPGATAGLDPTRIYFQSGFTKTTFNFGFPVTIWLFLAMLLSVADRYILKEYTGYEEVGVYSAVKDFIVKIATFTTIPVILAYHPMIVERWNRDRKEEAMHLIRQGLNYCLMIGFTVIILLMISRGVVFNLILELEVKNNFLVSLTLLTSAFLWQVALLLHKPLELLLKPRLMLVSLMISLVLNVAANLVFVPVFGYTASAVISLASVGMYIIIIFAMLFRFRKQGLFK